MMKSQGARQMQTTRSVKPRSTKVKKGTDAKSLKKIILKSEEGTYLFFVDCIPKYCKAVRMRMEADGFETDVMGDMPLLGDHMATKHFKTARAAKNSAKKLLKDLGTNPLKVRKIMIDPYYGLVT